MKIMKMNGSMEEYEGYSFYWVCGETEFGLVYDDYGKLYGIVVNGLPQDILDNIIEEPWSYDFPYTVKDYIIELGYISFLRDRYVIKITTP